MSSKGLLLILVNLVLSESRLPPNAGEVREQEAQWLSKCVPLWLRHPRCPSAALPLLLKSQIQSNSINYHGPAQLVRDGTGASPPVCSQ